MVKRNYFWELMTIMIVCIMSVGFASCGDDDDDDNAVSIVGTWVDDTGDSSEVSFTFRSDGTGYYKDKSGTSNFNYTYEESNKQLKLWYVDSSTVYNYSVSLTGKTLMLTRNSTTYVLRKK